jgi:hypothetical protein
MKALTMLSVIIVNNALYIYLNIHAFVVFKRNCWNQANEKKVCKL